MKLEEQYQLIEFADLGDERGNLVVIEGEGRDIPFDIKRVFYIYGSDGEVVRGRHANRETEFLLVSRHYDEKEYIRDYDAYRKALEEAERAAGGNGTGVL